MVLGAIMAVMYNTSSINRLLRPIYSGSRGMTVVFKTALSYPGNRRFRTAATVAMFALVLFTVVTIAFLASMQTAALDNYVTENSGGYDIITQTTLPISDLASRVLNDQNLASRVSAVLPFNNTVLLVRDLTIQHDFGSQVPAIGADPNADGASNFYT